jgi:hypothetical protein
MIAMDFDPSTRQLVNKILADFQTTRLDLADEAEVFWPEERARHR